VFFTKGQPTETVWVYDARSNVPRITKKDRPLTPEHFAEFEECFGKDANGRAKRKAGDSKEERWRSFTIEEVKARDFKIDALKCRGRRYTEVHGGRQFFPKWFCVDYSG